MPSNLELLTALRAAVNARVAEWDACRALEIAVVGPDEDSAIKMSRIDYTLDSLASAIPAGGNANDFVTDEHLKDLLTHLAI